MTWFTEQRQQWIAESLQIYGFINRQHLMKKFNVSNALAATDFRKFKRANPNTFKYDKQRKCYISNNHKEPHAEKREA